MDDHHNNMPPITLLFDILLGPIKMGVLNAALELKIADILEETEDINSIAKALDIKTDTKNLIYFLDSMVSLGLTLKQNKTYSNTAFAKHFLCTSSPTYMGNLVKNMSAMQHRNLNNIIQCIKNGPPNVKKEEILSNEMKWKNSVKHLTSYQKAGFASFAADLMESLPEFKTKSKIMDLGCGPGYICMEILKRHPKIEGVLCDLPGIIKLAKKEVEKEGLESRISFISGDYNEIEIGSGYDIIWASHNLYYVKEPIFFFKKIFNAINPNGVFICLHEGLINERTAPASIVLSRLSLALEGQDVSFEKGEIAAHLISAGFADVESKNISLATGENELVIAHKSRRKPL